MAHLLGYVNIMVEGYFIERFINICVHKNILLWKMQREKSSILFTNVGMKDFKKIRKIAKETKCKVRIKQKRGVPFLLHKYKKRKIFFAFLIFLLAIIFLSSQFIWNIDITGNEKMETQEIQQWLQDNGLTIGKWKNKINQKEIVHKMRLEKEQLAWVGIEIKGTNAIVKVVEAEEKPVIINESEYCNIISQVDGMITRIKAQNGTPLVKPGDVVKKGNILIGGYLEGKFTGMQYVHAEGEIEAKTWYSERKEIPFLQEKKEKTGNSEKKYAIGINNFRINLYKKLSKFEKYDTMEIHKKLKLFSDFYLPISLVEITNSETKTEHVTYSLQQAKDLGVKELQEILDKRVEQKQVINKQVNYKENQASVEVEVVYEVLEKIGTKEKIIF